MRFFRKYSRWAIASHLLLVLFLGQFAWKIFGPTLFHHLFYLHSSPIITYDETHPDANKADLIVFSYNRPLQLYAFLETVKKNVAGINELHVLYRTSNEDYERGYDIVKKEFPHAVFHAQSKTLSNDFQKLVLSITEESPSDFVSFAVDDIIITKPFNIAECVAALKKYRAYVFMVRAGLNLDYDHPSGRKHFSRHEITEEGFCLWTIRNGVRLWAYPHYVDFSIHNKGEILPDLKRIHFSAPNSMEGGWARLLYINFFDYLPFKKVYLKPISSYNFKRGLAFQDSRMVNVPLNLVNSEVENTHMNNYSVKDLNELFLKGYKIDISLFQGYANTKTHENLIPQFVLRKS